MTNQEFGRDGDAVNNGRASNKSQSFQDAASDVLSKVSGASREAATKAKETASETATTVTDHFKDLLDKQIGNSIAAAGLVATSVKRAADDINHQSPFTASIVRKAAERVEQFAEYYEGETVEQLTRSASDFTRRQPALVFGLAAFAGFLMFRAIASAPAAELSPLSQPEDSGSAA